MLRTPLHFALFALFVILAGWLLIAAPARSAELPAITYVAGRFPPYTLHDQAEHATGPTAALIAALGKRIGRPGPLVVQPLARALANAEHEPNMLIALIARTADREAKFHWVCPVLDYDAAMFRLRVRPDVVADTIEDLARWRVAGLNRDVKTEYLQRHGVAVELTPDEGDATRLLLYGRVDALPAHPATLWMRLAELGAARDSVVMMLPLPELTTQLYLAFGRNTAADVVATVTEACLAMTASGEIKELLQPAMQN